MAEDEALFDPTMKKKKKKKKVLIDLDSLDDSSSAPAVEEIDQEPEPARESVDNKTVDDDIDLSEDFSSAKKKKKKKKKGSPFDMDGVEESLRDAGQTGEEGGNEQESESKAIVDDLDLDFSMKKKKKKSKKKVAVEKDENTAGDAMENGAKDSDAEEGDNADEEIEVGPAWANRDYTYEELLTRVFDIMRAKNPDMVAGEKRKFVMKPPQVVRIGTKKTSFANFTEICRILHRQHKHLLQFLLAELGTSGSVDGNNQLIIKGRFQQKQIENVLRRYIKEYVTCHTCRSPDTMLHKETRLFFLQCETCGSRCSVASIKSGFQAITGKRAAMKNKQQ